MNPQPLNIHRLMKLSHIHVGIFAMCTACWLKTHRYLALDGKKVTEGYELQSIHLFQDVYSLLFAHDVSVNERVGLDIH